MKFDWGHIAMLVGAPMLMAFANYELNSNLSPWAPENLARAGFAALLCGAALLKQSPMVDRRPDPPTDVKVTQ